MNHAEIRDLIAPYALGALEEPDATLLRDHLRECGFCANLAREAGEVAHHMSYAPRLHSAPAGSQERLIASIEPGRQRDAAASRAPRRKVLGWLSRLDTAVLAPLAASLAVVLGLSAWNVSLMRDLHSER
ncbi:MAG: zf-HC2 domain-containing protein, partial [Chloroflexi bacterium]|nr:zf-HC2 domain-containing protein [Chloroflexota bacterium]